VTTAVPAELVAAMTRASGRVHTFPLNLRWYPTVSSTMDAAAEAVAVGAQEGLVIIADEQSHGRGRRGRVWNSPAGAGLYLSLVLRPALTQPLALMTLAAGVAVHQAIERSTGLIAALKWPNDVMIGRRKLAGILAEGLDIGLPTQSVVLGIGLNVLESVYPADLAPRVTSLEGELGRPIDRAIVIEELLVTLSAQYDRIRCGAADDILRAWRERAPSGSGTAVEWDSTSGARRGTTRGIDESGALLVQTETGIERLVAGEVRWIEHERS
jgi:BirA family biotin operon repressor/biotin-[acetyl-CoA-carboxylase] ligase